MCGIAALLGKHSPESAAAMVRAMNDSQAHRGPDDQGAVVLKVGQGIVGLGNRRLAILDLSPLGHQPMHNPDTGDVLAYNGEIYNSPDLRRELQQAGFTFRGRSGSLAARISALGCRLPAPIARHVRLCDLGWAPLPVTDRARSPRH
jgi:asparagine synthase (glutamine-hydrolysing)